MSPEAFVELLITRTIQTSFYWFFHNCYIFIVFIMNTIGIYGILFDLEFFLSDWAGGFMLWVLFLASIFLWHVFAGLLWTFVFWMMTIIFVPFVIVIPIPIMPLFVPIPLKLVILEYVPPFKILTKRGILPFIRRNIFRVLFTEDTIKHKFKKTLIETYGFLYDEFKMIFGDLLKNVVPEPVVISKELQDDDHKLDISSEGEEENKAESDKQDEDPTNKKIQDLINEELEVCLKSKQSFKTSDLSSIESLYGSIGDTNSYAECYATSIKAYVDNKL
jgi:hypothetical protein